MDPEEEKRYECLGCGETYEDLNEIKDSCCIQEIIEYNIYICCLCGRQYEFDEEDEAKKCCKGE